MTGFLEENAISGIYNFYSFSRTESIPNAYHLSGYYQIEENEIKLSFVITQNGNPISEILHLNLSDTDWKKNIGKEMISILKKYL